MTAPAVPGAKPAVVAKLARSDRPAGLRPGWITVAEKELADHILSSRFYVLLLVIGIASLVPLYFAAEEIRKLAEAASGAPAVFLALFTFAPEGVNLGPISFTVQSFVAIAAPLLGVAFGFDAVNGERHEGTLPRLLSQPIHRDDVINGKFAAALAIISIALAALLLVISGFGMLRLGILPSAEDALRLIAWLAVTMLYVALWLAFGLLLSVVVRRATTSALIGFGSWLFIAIPLIGPLLISVIGTFVASGAATRAEYASTVQWMQRLLPGQVYIEASVAMLSPSVTTLSAGELYGSQRAQQLQDTLLTIDQSLLLVWPQLVILFALTVGCFALAYVRFMRQEVRA